MDNQLWRVTGYDFWLRAVAGHPAQIYPGRPWAFWQYTGTGIDTGTGIVPRVSGNTDINVYAGSTQHWQAWLAANGAGP